LDIPDKVVVVEEIPDVVLESRVDWLAIVDVAEVFDIGVVAMIVELVSFDPAKLFPPIDELLVFVMLFGPNIGGV
jgi:hypothetical protein